MTLYAALLRLAGLSHREAAAFHGARQDSVSSWSTGRRGVPAGALAELHELIGRQIVAAEEIVAAIEAGGSPATEIGYCTDDSEAQQLGWPSAGAHWAMLARVWEQAQWNIDVTVVPRGSTPATAAAIEEHEKKV